MTSSARIAGGDIQLSVDRATASAELQQLRSEVRSTFNGMSDDALKFANAQDRYDRALKASNGRVTASVRNAELNLRRVQSEASKASSVVVRSANESTAALRREEAQFGRLGRGALAGSGLLRGLGRSVAFASTSFLGGAGLIFAIKSATDAATKEQEVEGQLETALKNRGEAVDGLRGRVKELVAANAQLGFGEADSTRSLTLAVTATGSLEGATRLLSVAQNVARARGTDLYTSTQLLTRAFTGSGRGLKALGVEVANGTKGYDALDAVQAKYAGRAVAFADSEAGARARANAELERTKVTIGDELLPVENKLAGAVADYLGKAKNQERIQRDVNSAVGVGADLAHDLEHAWAIVGPPVRIANRLLGGTAHTIEVLGTALVALKVRSVADGMGLLAGNTARAGAAAATATGEYNALAGAEGRAAAAGASAGRGGTGLPLGIPNVGGRPGVVGRINQYTGAGATGAGAAAASGLGLGILGAIAVGGFGAQQDSFAGGQDAYLDDVKQKWKFNNPALGKPAKPGAVFDINGKKYLVTYKNGAAYLYSREYLLAHQPVNTSLSATSGAGPHGAAAIPGQIASLTPKVSPVARSVRVALNVQAAQLAVARGVKGADTQLRSALQAQVALDHDDEKLQERLARTDAKNRSTHLNELKGIYADEEATLNEIASLDQKHDAVKTKSVKDRATAKKKADKDRDALIKRLYTEDIAGSKSSAAYALKARSEALNARYADRLAEAQTIKKATAAATLPASAVLAQQHQLLSGLGYGPEPVSPSWYRNYAKHPITQDQLRGQEREFLDARQQVIANGSNVTMPGQQSLLAEMHGTLKQIHTRLYQSENHLLNIRGAVRPGPQVGPEFGYALRAGDAAFA